MVIEETRDLAETADCVVIEAILVDDGLRTDSFPSASKTKTETLFVSSLFQPF